MSQQSNWRRFVERRRGELRNAYPCADPTRRHICPRHRSRVGPVTGICKPCLDGLYEQLAAEYVSHTKGMTMVNEDDRPLVPGPKPVHIPGQLELFGDDNRAPDHEDELERLKDVYDEMKVEGAVDDAA